MLAGRLDEGAEGSAVAPQAAKFDRRPILYHWRCLTAKERAGTILWFLLILLTATRNLPARASAVFRVEAGRRAEAL